MREYSRGGAAVESGLGALLTGAGATTAAGVLAAGAGGVMAGRTLDEWSGKMLKGKNGKEKDSRISSLAGDAMAEHAGGAILAADEAWRGLFGD